MLSFCRLVFLAASFGHVGAVEITLRSDFPGTLADAARGKLNGTLKKYTPINHNLIDDSSISALQTHYQNIQEDFGAETRQRIDKAFARYYKCELIHAFQQSVGAHEALTDFGALEFAYLEKIAVNQVAEDVKEKIHQVYSRFNAAKSAAGGDAVVNTISDEDEPHLETKAAVTEGGAVAERDARKDVEMHLADHFVGSTAGTQSKVDEDVEMHSAESGSGSGDVVDLEEVIIILGDEARGGVRHGCKCKG